MNIIQSAGGPYVGLARKYLHLWDGVAGKRFVGLGSSMPNDYEAAGVLVDGVAYDPCSIAKLSGVCAEALIVSMPLETALIAQDGPDVYIAQVHYADHDWSFNTLQQNDYLNLEPDESFKIEMQRGEFILFDAAYAGGDVGSDSISCQVERGAYVFDSGLLKPDESTLLTLIRLLKL